MEPPPFLRMSLISRFILKRVVLSAVFAMCIKRFFRLRKLLSIEKRCATTLNYATLKFKNIFYPIKSLDPHLLISENRLHPLKKSEGI
jgi:hypothetical protein